MLPPTSPAATAAPTPRADLLPAAGAREEYRDFLEGTFGKYFDAVCDDVARRKACDPYDTVRL